MKKLCLPILVVLIAVGCHQEEINTKDQNLVTQAMKRGNTRKANKSKIDVYHYDAHNERWIMINISANALNGHKNHDDIINLNTQENIDDFGSTEITTLKGKIVIGTLGSPNFSITNFDSLSSLTSVKGITIHYNNELTSLSGLNNLKFIGDSLTIFENPKLTDIDDLENLESIGGTAIVGMNGIISLDGLNKLTIIGGDLEITENSQLTGINGLLNLDSISGTAIVGMNGIISLDGLNKLTTIGGDLEITENPQLTGINGLLNLDSIGGTAIVGMNGIISDLDGLNKLTTIGGDLEITDNPLLIDFCGLNTLISADGLLGSLVIANNGFDPTYEDLEEGNCKLIIVN